MEQELSFEENSFWELRYDNLDISDILIFLKKILALDLVKRKAMETIPMEVWAKSSFLDPVAMILCGEKGCCSCSSVKGLEIDYPGLHRWI